MCQSLLLAIVCFLAGNTSCELDTKSAAEQHDVSPKHAALNAVVGVSDLSSAGPPPAGSERGRGWGSDDAAALKTWPPRLLQADPPRQPPPYMLHLYAQYKNGGVERGQVVANTVRSIRAEIGMCVSAAATTDKHVYLVMLSTN